MALSPLAGGATTTVKISDFNTMIAALNAELAALGSRLDVLEAKKIPPDLTSRVAALENEPDPVLPPDLTARVAALETTVAAFRTPPAATDAVYTDPMLSAIPHTPADPTKVELIYDKATIYYGGMELHALRIAENKWRLVANLNYITINQILWTYDEIVEGTPDEVYRHAQVRLTELAKLKVAHDAAHQRVREMSEGQS